MSKMQPNQQNFLLQRHLEMFVHSFFSSFFILYYFPFFLKVLGTKTLHEILAERDKIDTVIQVEKR